MGTRMKLVYSLLYGCILLVPLITHAKRHSRQNKIERFERRAKEAAQNDTPLSLALSKRTKSMSFEEARLAQDYYRTQKEDDMVIKCGERILAVGGDQEIMRLTRLELAELFLKKRKFVEAEKHAQDYLVYYPGTDENKKASFIALSATYQTQHSSHRDQQKTLSTIQMALAFLEKYPQETELHAQVQEMLTNSYLKLIRSELTIITTQLNTHAYTKKAVHHTAAQKRLETLKKTYLPHAPQAQKRVDELEQLLLQRAPEGTTAPEKKTITIAAQERSPWYKRSWSAAKDFVSEDITTFFA